MLTADERAQIRAELDPAQQAERWRSLALRLLDELEAAESQRGEYAAAVAIESLQKQLSDEKIHVDELAVVILDVCNMCDAVGCPAEVELTRDTVKLVCDAYRSEKERADRLQRENETLRAARESLEPVGWMLSVGDNPEAHRPAWFSPSVSYGTKRRIYLAPPQRLEESC